MKERRSLCTLPEDINNCISCSKDKRYCLENNEVCGFQEWEADRSEEGRNITGYVRKPRWYEKYYKH